MNILDNYLWIKALHLIFMVAWFAGLFYIFRLFVYHTKFKTVSQLHEAYTVMEKKLIFIIMNPGMILTIVFGLLLVRLNPSVMLAAWFHAKLSMILILAGYHMFCIMTYRRFSEKDFFLSEKACRWINEIPTIALIIVVILVVVKPL